MKNGVLSAPLGIRADFHEGARVLFPAGNRKFHLRISSMITGESVFDCEVQENPGHSSEFKTRQTYCIPWEIEITQNGGTVFLHRFNPVGKDICINMLPGAMGDMIAWLPAALSFRHDFSCRITVLMKEEYIQLFESAHPELRFIPQEKYRADEFYAVYPVGVWGYGDFDHNPTDFQKDNLIDHADNILGVHSKRRPPELAPAQSDCAAEYGKYVCIAARASRKMKQWNCEGGWEKVTEFLKKNGFRVFCIDADSQAMPANAEDFTGKLPLRQRIDLIRGCAFMIGLGSGLSWIAWACGKPVVMISGFSEEWTEFPTPYRIINKTVCHGCFNHGDMRFNDFDRCPESKNFECTRAIPPESVIEAVRRIPAFQNAAEGE